MIGIGIAKGTNDVITKQVNSSAKIFPNNRKLNDKGFVNSSIIFKGSKKGNGLIYCVTNQIPLLLYLW